MIYDSVLETLWEYNRQDPKLFDLGIKHKSYPNLNGIDIDSEYEKIMHKQSKLSKSERDRVIWLYNRKQEKYQKSR